MPTAVPTEPPQPEATSGWSFVGVRISSAPTGELVLYGDLVNNAEASQALMRVTGTFYDTRGQVIADADDTSDYWPVEIVPPGGRIPFELYVVVDQGVANFDLRVEAQPSDVVPRWGFEFLNVSQWDAEDAYCLAGQLRNLEVQPQELLVVVATLYDARGEVVNFLEQYYGGDVLGGGSLDVDLCVDPLGQEVASYELSAWTQ
jgi:hypothetical protein